MNSKNFSSFYKIKSPIKKKILLLLFGGISLGLAYSPGKQFRVLRQVASEWQKISRRNLVRNLHDLYDYGFIDWKEKSDQKKSNNITNNDNNYFILWGTKEL